MQLSRDQKAGISFLRRPGVGEKLLMLHGIGSNAQTFAALIEHLPKDWDILAWDAPGYGASEPLSDPWPSEEDYARKLHDFLRALNWASGHILGHSLGTLMAAKFAQLFPHDVKRLVLVSCALGYGVPKDGVMPSNVASRIEDLEQLGAKEFAASRAARLVYDPKSNPHCVEQVRQVMAKVKLPGYAHATRMLASGQLEKTLHAVTCPTLLIIGEDDCVTPLEQSQRAFMARKHAGTEDHVFFKRVSQSGHAICQQSPAPVARYLIDFLGDEAGSYARLSSNPDLKRGPTRYE